MSDRLTAALADRYRIERELGQGGMATVYLAHDLKHDRKVALKVLRPELAVVIGAERFLAEIKTTANLQHPHILALHDSGEVNGTVFYVMPFVEGESLRDRLAREKQLPIADAVQIATEVAGALDYAHRHGVIHRDIKPENILLHEGRALVADFGIALAATSAGSRMTETGMSLGTPHYMSPEQAMGERTLDARTDVYALGCVLYEMLTGQPPFTGPTAQAIVAKVMTEKPAPPSATRETVPGEVEDAVLTALAKLPADRFAGAAAFAAALRAEPGAAGTSQRRPSASDSVKAGIVWRGRAMVLATLMAVACVIAAWGWLRREAEPILHLSVPPPAATSFLQNPGCALSPDGSTVVFAAASGGTTRLYRRSVNGFRVEAIEGSDDASYPFFSPDGAWIGFYTRSRQLRKVPLGGGQPTTLVDIPYWRSGAVWRHDGTIVVVSDSWGLYFVPDHGGSLSPLTEPDTSAGEYRHDTPQELADGRLLFTVVTREQGVTGGGYLAVLKPGESRRQRLLGDAWGTYVEPGYLISRPGNEVVASRYDLARGRFGGKPIPVLEGLGNFLSVNNRGDVAYFSFPKTPTERFLTLVDRSGAAARLPVAAGAYRHPRLSPNGTRVAVNRDDDLWVLDLGNNGWTRLTTKAGITEPQWSPDGRRIAHSTFVTSIGYYGLVWRDADGGGEAHLIHSGVGDDWPSDWSPDGRHMAVYGGPTGLNVSVVDFDSAHTLHPVTRMAATGRNARFSPDGRWLAYQSDETGRMQVYVVSYPGLGQKRAISTEGGTEPAWRPAGGELYYRNGPRMMVTAIRTAPTLEVGTPRELFRGSFEEDLFGDRSYDVMPDGQHFLMFESDPASAPELRIIRSWVAELDATLGRR
jgi:eukaryotic-like serine/threonine-protein kinase